MPEKAVVFGPDVDNKVSGHGWVKYNILKALHKEGYEVVSAYHSDKDESLRKATSSEERLSTGKFEFLHVGVAGPNSWSNVLETIKPAIVLVVDDIDKCWYVGIPEEIKKYNIKTFYYYISESSTINRYLPTERDDFKYLDALKILHYYDIIIPATATTKLALIEDMGYKFKVDVEPITPPVWKWDTSEDKGYTYRKSVDLDLDTKIYFTIVGNQQRKRLDQVLIYFQRHLVKKSCCGKGNVLIIHTNIRPRYGYDISPIASRLRIDEYVRINERSSMETMEGIFSAGDVFISLPAAEGYGLPLHEALLLGKDCIHSNVGHFKNEVDLIKGSKIELVMAKHPYFTAGTNEIWYEIGLNPSTKRKGRSGKYKIEELINTPEEFQEKILAVILNGE